MRTIAASMSAGSARGVGGVITSMMGRQVGGGPDDALEEPSLLRRVARRWWLLAVVTAGAAALVATIQGSRPPSYEATAVVVLGEGWSDVIGAVPAGAPEARLAAEAERATDGRTLQLAAELLEATRPAGADRSVEDLRDAVAVEADPQGASLVVTASAPTAASAVHRADAVAAAYAQQAAGAADRALSERMRPLEAHRDELAERVRVLRGDLDARSAAHTAEVDRISLSGDDDERFKAIVRRQNADPAFVQLTEELKVASRQLEQARVDVQDVHTEHAVHGDAVAAIEAATVPPTPAAPRPRQDAVLAALIAFVVAATGLTWRADLQRERQEGVRAALGTTRLGTLSRVTRWSLRRPDRLIAVHAGKQETVRRAAAASLRAATRGLERRIIVVTSAARGDGRTTTALQLATTARDQGWRVCLVDADPAGRSKSLSTSFHRQDAPGLFDVGEPDAGRQVLTLVNTLPETAEDNGVPLALLPVGHPRTDGRPSPAALTEMLVRLASAYDLVLVDAPPLPSSALSVDVAASASGAVLVTSPTTSVAAAQVLADRLRAIDVPLIGEIHDGGAQGRWRRPAEQVIAFVARLWRKPTASRASGRDNAPAAEPAHVDSGEVAVGAAADRRG